MSFEREIALLETELEDTGFFSRLREGIFDPAEFDRALRKLSSISIREDDLLPRRLVSILWYLPLLMTWQIERIRDRGGDVAAFQRATIQATNVVEQLLGVP